MSPEKWLKEEASLQLRQSVTRAKGMLSPGGQSETNPFKEFGCLIQIINSQYQMIKDAAHAASR